MELKIAEFWEHHFQCRYPSSPVTPYNQNWKRTCTGLEKLSRDGLEFEAQLQYVSDAVMALAYAFRLIVALFAPMCLLATSMCLMPMICVSFAIHYAMCWRLKWSYDANVALIPLCLQGYA